MAAAVHGYPRAPAEIWHPLPRASHFSIQSETGTPLRAAEAERALSKIEGLRGTSEPPSHRWKAVLHRGEAALRRVDAAIHRGDGSAPQKCLLSTTRVRDRAEGPSHLTHPQHPARGRMQGILHSHRDPIPRALTRPWAPPGRTRAANSQPRAHEEADRPSGSGTTVGAYKGN